MKYTFRVCYTCIRSFFSKVSNVFGTWNTPWGVWSLSIMQNHWKIKEKITKYIKALNTHAHGPCEVHACDYLFNLSIINLLITCISTNDIWYISIYNWREGIFLLNNDKNACFLQLIKILILRVNFDQQPREHDFSSIPNDDNIINDYLYISCIEKIILREPFDKKS